MKFFLSFILFSFLAATSLQSFTEEKRQYIRIYKLNKKNQAVRIQMRDKTAKASGCHNFITTPKVYRITQIGFESCSLYRTKDCPIDAIIEGQWKEKDKAIHLTQGGEWLFTYQDPKGIKAKSWSCH